MTASTIREAAGGPSPRREAARSRKGGVVPWIAIALLGAILGAVTATWGHRDLLFREVSSQELPHDFVARAVDSGPRASEPFGPTDSPLYTLLLSGFHLVRTDPMPARWLQLVLLGALIPLTAGFAAGRTFGRRAGPLAAFLTLFSGPLWIHLGWIGPQAWQVPPALLAVGLLAQPGPAGTNRRGPGPVAALAAGALIGLSRLFGAAWAPFLVVLAFGALVARRRFVSGAALLVGSLLLFVSPLLNSGRKTPIASPPLGDGGFEMAQGFHDGATGLEPRRLEKGDWRWTTTQQLILNVQRDAGKPVTVREANREWYRRSFGWMAAHPLPAAGLILRKAGLSLSGYDAPSPDSLVFRAKRVTPWAVDLLYLTTVLVGLSFAGLFAAAKRDRGSDAAEATDPFPVLLLLVATVLCGAFFYVRSGDRLALLVALTGPAAWTLLHVRSRPVLLAVALPVAALAALPWFITAPRAESAAEDRFLLAGILERTNKPAESMAELDKAIRIDPSHAGAHIAMAGALAQDGLFDQALEEAQKGAETAPGLVASWRLLATLEQQNGHYDEAAAAYRKVIELDPLNFEVHNNLGTLYVALNRYDDAVASLRRAVEINPNYRSARVNLAEVEKRGRDGLQGATISSSATGGAALQAGIQAAMQRLQSGDVAGAGKALDALRQQYGATPDLDFATGTLVMQEGDLPQAIELFERARKGLPGNPFLMNNLGTAYARANRIPEAVAAWEEVLRLDPTNELALKNLNAIRQNTPPP